MIDLDEFSAENIADRMKSRLLNPASKIEGSFAMDCIQSVSQELSRLSVMNYIDILDQYLIDTAEGEYLDNKAKDYFMERNPATSSTGIVIFTGVSGTLIPEGTIVVAGELSFSTVQDNVIDGSGEVRVQVMCTTHGANGNIMPDMITGLSSASNISGIEARNEDAFEGGTDEETDDHFRNRIYEKKQNPIIYGNKNSYEIWAKEVSGVGNAKCLPCKNGNGSACLVILSSSGGVPDDKVIQNVTNHIEEKRLINAKITVMKAIPNAIRIDCRIVLKNGYSFEDITESFKLLLNDYLIKKVFGEKKEISYYKISDLLFSINGVDDIIDYTINNARNSIAAKEEEFFEIAEVLIHD